MSQENNAPQPPKRTVLIGCIVLAISQFTDDELEAIERYCHNYHHFYQKPGKKYIITDITVEPIKAKNDH